MKPGAKANLPEGQIDSLVRQMTLEEKVSLLSGKDTWHTVPVAREIGWAKEGIPSLVMTDGPHGVRPSEPETGRRMGPTTAFPTGVSMAASWNPELVERVGVALGEETRAMGCQILLGPCVNIVRHPLAGRNFESYSEDPFLAGEIGVAWVKGVQSQGVGTSLKHFACNNQEIERFRGSSVVDERTLREIYLAQFEKIVKEADPWTVMCSYNRINGVYASQNAHLLRNILKEEWGYQGVVISDWGANHTTVESVLGGLDIEMPGPARYYGDFLVHAVNTWQIDEAVIDESVRRIIRLILKAGLPGEAAHQGEGLSKRPEQDTPEVNTPEHQALARELAEEAITLLKNDRNVLPFDARKLRRLAVIGPNAAEMQVGGGGSSAVTPPYQVNPLDALRQKLDGKVEIAYEQGCGYQAGPEAERIQKAAGLAGSADAVVVFAGMPKYFESEGSDRPHMALPGPQAELIRAVAAANPKTVVVINAGAPVEMPWIDDVAAVLLAYYPGLEGGNAITRILLGEVAPSGKLPVTFPKRLEDTPAFINYPGGMEVHYGEGIFVGYRYYDAKDIEPLFPFGHGLSYTTFDYRDLQAPSEVEIGKPVRVSLQVKNTGNCAAKEIVQLYVGDRQASLARPVKELKGFRKLMLQPGEAQTIEFSLDSRAFAFYDPHRKEWIVEPGEFEILVGSSSRDIRVKKIIIMIDD